MGRKKNNNYREKEREICTSILSNRLRAISLPYLNRPQYNQDSSVFKLHLNDGRHNSRVSHDNVLST